MICKNCGHVLGATDRFCPNCGSRVIVNTPAPKEESGFTPSFRRTEEKPQARSAAPEEEATPRRKRHFEFEEFNWDLSGFPTERKKKTEDIDFSWESVREERPSRVSRQEPKIKGKETAEEADAKKEAALKAAKEAEAKTHEQAMEEAIFGVKNHEGEITDTIRMDAAEDLTKTTKIDKFYTYNKKNEEFQQLLDREYNRLKAQIDADAEKDAELVRSEAPVQEPVRVVHPAPKHPAAPAFEEPVVEEPAAPVFEEPVVEEPAAPVFEEPVVEEPAAPVFEEPVVEEPAAPVFEEPVVEEPAAPVFEEPVVEEPAAPVFEEPAVEEPVAPVEEKPVAPKQQSTASPFSSGANMTDYINDFTTKGFSLAALLSAAAKQEQKKPTPVQPVVKEPEAPIVEEPVVEEPVIEEPAAPVVEEPVVEEPVVEEPVIEEPVAPVIEEPVVEEPVIEEPAAPVFEEPVVEEPVVEEPVVKEPAVEEPVADIFAKPEMTAEEALFARDFTKPEEPAAEEPVAEELEEPVLEEITFEAPEEPAIEEPEEAIFERPAVEATEEAIFERPVVEEPAVEEPAAPVVEEPVVEEPAVEEPAAAAADFFARPVEKPEEKAPVVEEAPVTEDSIWARPGFTRPAAEEPVAPVVEEPVVEEKTFMAPPVEEAPAVEEPVVEEPAIEIPAEETPYQAEELNISVSEPREEMFDPEMELELFRRKVEKEMGITLEELEEEDRTEYVGTVLASVPQGVKAYEEEEKTESITLEDLFEDADKAPEEIAQGAAAAAAVAGIQGAALAGEFSKPKAEEIQAEAEAVAEEAVEAAAEKAAEVLAAEAVQEKAGAVAEAVQEKAEAVAEEAVSNAESVEQFIKEDTKNPPKDNRITYHDVFAEEIEAERSGADEVKPKNHTFLKVLAVILCICIVAEIVVICIKYMAPDSAAAIKLQDIFNSIYGAISSLIG